MKKCNEVMTKNPACCLQDDIVSKVAELMKSKDIGGVPIIENEQTRKLIGIVPTREIASPALRLVRPTAASTF